MASLTCSQGNKSLVHQCQALDEDDLTISTHQGPDVIHYTHVDTHHAADVFPLEYLLRLVVVVVVDSQWGVNTRQFISNPTHCRAAYKSY